jgi:hypothetical protein
MARTRAMTGAPPSWPKSVSLAEARRGAVIRLAPDEASRAAIARELDLQALESLEAEMDLSAWLDGAVVAASWRADIVQICGVSLDPFATRLDGRFTVHIVPAGSPNAPAPPEGEIVIDPDAEDPPDVLEGEAIDLSGYVVEHLALEIDPFPRKPGVEFEPPVEPTAPSPFDALRGLKGD